MRPLNKWDIHDAVDYLMTRMGWAAREHPAFDEFAADLRRLRARLAEATVSSDRPVRSPAKCFDCGDAHLERIWTDEGLAEEWTCPRCQRVYSHAQYGLAVRAHMEAI